jgi:hypothetical protein
MGRGMIVRPGPPCIDPGLAPGGVVIHVYAVPTGRHLRSRHLSADDIVNGEQHGDDVVASCAQVDATAAVEDLRADESFTCLVAYDGDTGERFTPAAWL